MKNYGLKYFIANQFYIYLKKREKTMVATNMHSHLQIKYNKDKQEFFLGTDPKNISDQNYNTTTPI